MQQSEVPKQPAFRQADVIASFVLTLVASASPEKSADEILSKVPDNKKVRYGDTTIIEGSPKKLELNDVPDLSTCSIAFFNGGKKVKTVKVSANLTKMLVTFLKDTENYSGAHFNKDLEELGLMIVPISPPHIVYEKYFKQWAKENDITEKL